MTRIIQEILWWWNCRHKPMRKDSAWRKADEAERAAKASGFTQGIGRARLAKARAINLALRSHVKGV